MIAHYVTAASSYAKDIDDLVWLVTLLVGFWFVLVQGMFFWLLWRYRAGARQRSDYITGEEKHLGRWIHWPHNLIILCDVVIIAAAINVWYHVKQTMPEADRTVRIIGQQWAWIFQHPGPDGQLDTDDDITTVDELHVQEGLTYAFELQSRDVLHSFFVPVFRLKQDAVPGRTVKGWFKPTATGVHDILCAEICGIGHGLMNATIHIETAAEHAAWMQAPHPAS